MIPATETWTDYLRRTLLSYEEHLLRLVSNKLCKPRNHWPAEELIDRCLGTLTNAAVLDRRIKDLEPASRLVLALMAHSRQHLWPVGHLVEMLVTLGQPDGLAPVRDLLEAGLLYPQLFPLDQAILNGAPGKYRLKGLGVWLGQAQPPIVFVHPAVMERSLGLEMDLPDCPGAVSLKSAKPREADGLEWLVRLAVLWQQVGAAPLRRTQQRDFFKRDLDRLQGDPLLSSPPADSLTQLPDLPMFTVALGLATGVIVESDGEIRAGSFDPAWTEGLAAALTQLWSALPRLESWNPLQGWHIPATPGNPYPAAWLLALLLLGRLPGESWARADLLEQWLAERHPYWNVGAPAANAEQQSGRGRGAGKGKREPIDAGLARFLLGVAYPMRLLEAARDQEGNDLVRLSALGRGVLALTAHVDHQPTFPQTLLVQPNLEILAYRQGLSPELIVTLTKFATWRGLGAALTLQLEPQSVYRALEGGESYSSIVQTLERHGMKALPTPVLDSLRTWSNKRDRISVYPAAALFEFPGPAELADALARGLPAVRLTDRLAIVPNESAIDYRHFRLTGTRDYCLPTERCVDVEADGITLSVDLARSDLLLETEVQGLAELVPGPGLQGRRLYRLTPASLAAARLAGWSLTNLEVWFQQRTGMPLSPAGQLLFSAADLPPLELRRQLVLYGVSPMAIDGLQQWPATRALIQARLGPTTVVVAEASVDLLRERCRELGLKLFQGEG